MNETAFETIAQAAAVLKLDFSSEEFAGFAWYGPSSLISRRRNSKPRC